MSFLEENRDLVNIGLVIIGILIIIYFIMPHVISTKILMMQVEDLREEVKELRKIVWKMKK